MSVVDQEGPATIRELIIQLAEVEDTIRVIAHKGATPAMVQLAEWERSVVAALRRRHVHVSLGRGAEAVMTEGPASAAGSSR